MGLDDLLGRSDVPEDAKDAVRAAAAELRLFEALLDTIPDTIYFKDRSSRFTRVNKAQAGVLGLADPASAVGKQDSDFFTPEHAAAALADEQQVIETGDGIVGKVEQIRRADGDFRWVLTTKMPLRDPKGDVTGTMGVTRDITAIRLAEQARDAAESRFHRIIDFSPMGTHLYELLPDDRLVFLGANPTADKVLGVDHSCFIGKTMEEAFPALTGTDVGDALRRIARAGERWSMQGLEYSEGDFLGVFDVHAFQTEPGFVAVMFMDVTERKRAEDERRQFEAQVQHAQKLESLGVLAGGIAHDFNNVLMGVLGNASLALATLPAQAPARHYIQQVETAALRAADLARQMLAYSGKGQFVVEPIDLADLVEEMSYLLEASISRKALLRRLLAPEAAAVQGDATQLRQVVMNLVTNASDSLGEEQGVITIRTSVVEVDEQYLAGTYIDDDLPAGRYVQMEVSDTGCGMDEETRVRMFEPFFSTKKAGRGLGMAAVLGIVRGHSGAIKVYSEPGAGTSIRVLLPCCHTPVPAEVEAPSLSQDAPTGSGLVLVADDEASVRQVTQMALEMAGHEVILARDGEEAVSAFRDHVNEITAVLLDMNMPRMGGEEALVEIQRLRPDVPVILSSGFNEQDSTDRVVGRRIAGFIQKPYRPSELLDILRAALTGETPPA